MYAAVYSDIEITSETGGALTKEFDLSYDGGERADAAKVGKNRINLGADTGSARNIGPFDIERLAAVGGGTVQVTPPSGWNRPIPVGGYVDVTYKELDASGSPTGPAVNAKLECVAGRGSATQCEGVQSTSLIGSIQGIWRLVLPEDQQADSEYLTFGTWLSVPDEDDGRFDLGTFAYGKASADTRLDTLVIEGTHTAKYAGPATGIYAEGAYKQPTGSQDGRPQIPMVVDARVGAFSASVSLEATFSETDPATLSGGVTGFKENGKGLGNWVVSLNQAEDTGATGTVRFTGDTSGEADGRPWAGKWGANFFMDGEEGPVLKVADMPTGLVDPAAKAAWIKSRVHESVPGYTAGTFSASTVDEDTPQNLDALHIVGAFGATKQQPTPTQ